MTGIIGPAAKRRDNNLMILIALGANQNSPAGPPAATFRAALDRLAAAGVETLALSRLYSSPAWPDPNDPPYTNAVALVRTDLSPAELLKTLHAVEAALGRERRTANAPRPLDLDLIDYDGRVETGPAIPILPHPRVHERAFVLAPLLDIAPAWRHPVTGESAADLLKTVEALGNRAFPAQINLP